MDTSRLERSIGNKFDDVFDRLDEMSRSDRCLIYSIYFVKSITTVLSLLGIGALGYATYKEVFSTPNDKIEISTNALFNNYDLDFNGYIDSSEARRFYKDSLKTY